MLAIGCLVVPPPGFEPGRVSPAALEAAASTNSASHAFFSKRSLLRDFGRVSEMRAIRGRA